MFSSQNSQVSNDAVFVEDIFSTFLYTGNGSTQTITNGIDLAGEGGLVWIKNRTGAISHALIDTARGGSQVLSSDTTSAQANYSPQGISAFDSSGFTVNGAATTINSSSYTYVSWTFRKQPKFFDVVTVSHTNGVDNTIDFSGLGTIGCVIIKRTDSAQNWYVWHRSLGNGYYGLFLNSTNSPSDFGTAPVSVSGTTVTMTDSSAVGSYFGTGTYVVYAFAHNAGGFGLTGTDNVISCGSFTTDASGRTTIDLGYEPQWVLIKRTTGGTGNWELADNMRKWTVSGNAALYPNLSNAENNPDNYKLNATGFSTDNGVGSSDYIYIAIRRGPMKVPTSGTSVFKPTVGLDGTSPISTGFPVDMFFDAERSGSAINTSVGSRLTGNQKGLITSSTSAELDTIGASVCWQNNTAYTPFVFGSSTGVQYAFRRAPSFFDEVCYTGDGTNGKAYNHNLTVVPELVIVKGRSSTSNWKVLYQPDMRVLTLNTTAAYESAANTKYYFGNDTIDISPTATQFTVSNGGSLNVSGATYVAYLFATCAGVSKVGSYTGTGATLQINCGFTSGARFVLIKRTDSTGQWYVWDSARGIVAGNDPYLLLNTTDAEVTIRDWIDPYSAGFELSNDSGSDVNLNGCTFIYLAIA